MAPKKAKWPSKGLTTTKATVTIEVEGGTGWPAELMKDAERQLRFTQSVGPAGLDLYFYDPEADTLDLRTASRKLPKLSPGCFFYVVRRDMQPAHEDGDSNADPELVKLMKRGKAQQPVQAATSSDSAQLSSLVEVLRLQVQTSVGAALASAGEPRAKKRAATGANYLKEDTDGKRGTGDCNTARDVVRLLWDEPIEGSGGEYTPETCPRAWLFLKTAAAAHPFDKKDLSHLQSLTRCKKEIYFHNIENILCILRMRKAEQEVPDDHYKLEGISRPGILDVADFILGTHKLTAMEENVAGWMDGKDKVDSGEYKATGAKRKANCKKKQEIEHHDSCEEPARKVAEQKGKARVRAPPTDEESDEEDDVEDKLEDDNESGNEDEDEGEDEGEDEDEDAEAASSRKRNRKAETKGQEAKQEKQKAGKRKKQEKEMEKEAKKPKAAAMTEKKEAEAKSKEKGKAAAAKKAAAESRPQKRRSRQQHRKSFNNAAQKEAEKKAKEKEKAAAAKKAAAEKEAAKTKAQAEAAAAAQERKAAEKKLKEKDKAVAAEKLAEAPAEKSRKKRKAAYELAAEPIIPNPRQLPPFPSFSILESRAAFGSFAARQSAQKPSQAERVERRRRSRRGCPPQLSRPILRTDKKLYVQPSPEDGGGVVDVNHALRPHPILWHLGGGRISKKALADEVATHIWNGRKQIVKTVLKLRWPPHFDLEPRTRLVVRGRRSTEREHTILVPFDQSKTAYGQAPGRVLHFDTSTVYYVQYAQVELDWDAEYELFLALQHEETDAEGEMTFALRNGPAVTVGKVEDRRTFRRSISYRPHPRPLRGEISDFNEGTVEGKDNWWHKWDIFMLKK
eukprot:tig00021135_g18928.t1